MPTTPEDASREQRNMGSGTFVNGNVFGGVHNYELLGTETKAHLAQIAKTSPDLAKLLATAATRSAQDLATAELIAATARRFHLASSVELLESATKRLERMSFPSSVEMLDSASRNLERLAPKILNAADQIGSNRHGRRGWEQ
ncbi:hypothetical protein ACFRMQ_23815 [Kitasatospora sp. NPDC056783]|uniref:hypothetical protein n=1 Tax=Kitasatospora sp. NPDC056783 TaxID=3345943 RepID=UPI0036B42A77